MRKRFLRVSLVVLAAAVVVAGTAFGSSQPSVDTIAGEAQPAVTSQDEQDIRDTITQVAVALENADRDELAALMCPADSQAYLDNTYDPGDEGRPADQITSVDVRWVAVRVEDSNAAATFETEYSNGEVTVYLSKIDGAWLMCEDAEDAMTTTDSAPATPTD